MKVLIDHGMPFIYAHGGLQTQIEQTLDALRAVGVDAEPLRWFDGSQTADVIHHFGRPAPNHIRYAQGKGMKYVMSELLTGQGSRSLPRIYIQRAATSAINTILPAMFSESFRHKSFQIADAVIALTSWEKRLMRLMFNAPNERLHVVPNGVEKEFFESAQVERGKWLVCAATITERKRVVELAEAALASKVPVWIVGKPYSDNDPYYKRFLALHRQNPSIVRFEGPVSNRTKMAMIYREARGFVLLSAMESLSLSALEASACGCPLLLSDLRWARCSFGNRAQYCSTKASIPNSAECLRSFWEAAPSLAPPETPATWEDVARQLSTIYESVMSKH